MYVSAKSSTKQLKVCSPIERGRHRIGRCLPLLFLAMVLGFYGCKSEKERSAPWKIGEEEYEDEDSTVYTLEETGGDSLLVGSDTYHDMAAVGEKLLYKLNAIKSPDMLLNTMDEYENYINKEESDLDDDSERTRLNALNGDIRKAYERVCCDYMMPYRGVVETIQMVRKTVEDCKSSKDLNRLMDVRHSYFRMLPNVHRIVAEPDKRRDVYRQAQDLLKLLQRKQAEYGD